MEPKGNDMAGDGLGEFKPCVSVDETTGITEAIFEDTAYVAVPVFDGIHHYMDKHVAMDDGRLVGFAVWQTAPAARLSRSTSTEAVADWEPDHDDFCRLSRAFNEVAHIAMGSQDDRINEWLKRLIAGSHPSLQGGAEPDASADKCCTACAGTGLHKGQFGPLCIQCGGTGVGVLTHSLGETGGAARLKAAEMEREVFRLEGLLVDAQRIPSGSEERPDWPTVNATYEKWKSRAEALEQRVAALVGALTTVHNWLANSAFDEAELPEALSIDDLVQITLAALATEA